MLAPAWLAFAPLLASSPESHDLTLKEVWARTIPGRSRSVVRIDPVEQALITSTLQPAAPWASRPVSGWTTTPAGYAWFRIESPQSQVLLMNASGVSMAYVNGEPRVGDVYGYGTFFVPVQLRKGMNDVLVTGFRGPASLNWRKPTGDLEIEAQDLTAPDFNAATNKPHGDVVGVVIRNNSTRARRVDVRAVGAPDARSDQRWLPPLGTVKATVQIPAAQEFELVLSENGKVQDRHRVTLEAPKVGESFRRTFVSAMDGSAQYYAVNPASSPNPPVLVLSLHGASVEAIGQARAYGPKAFADIVCPTNRRPFGFNWETVGRRDALEVLEHARSLGAYDPARTMLTGHSMGGHGAWHLGVHHASKWAAVGPCAGWISFDTYAGGANYDLSDPMQQMLQRANLLSDTLRFKENLSWPETVYIHHGAADDVVPPTEARRMRQELEGIARVLYHEEPGGGHWFDNNPAPGADSVDWKPMFDLFASVSQRPWQQGQTRRIVVADPSIQDPIGPVTGWVAERVMEPATFELTNRGTEFRINTQNVRSVRIQSGSSGMVLDNQRFDVSRGGVFERINGRWTRSERQQLPTFARGFHEVYQNGVRWVVPTEGSSQELAWAWSKIRFDLEQMWYRANATPHLWSEAEARKDRSSVNRLFYGGGLARALRRRSNADEALPKLALPQDSALLIARPMPALGPSTVWAAMDGNSPLGRRLTERIPLFSPGVGIPEIFAVETSMLERGAAGIHTTGFWGPFGNTDGLEIRTRSAAQQ